MFFGDNPHAKPCDSDGGGNALKVIGKPDKQVRSAGRGPGGYLPGYEVDFTLTVRRRALRTPPPAKIHRCGSEVT